MKYIKSLIFSSLLIVSSCSSNKIPYSRQEFLKQNDAILQNADVSAESKALTCEKPTISKKETFFSGASKYGNNEGSWCKVSMDDLTEFLDFSFHNMNNIQNGMDTDKLQKEYVNVRDKTFGTNALKTSDIFSNNLAFSATLSKDDTNNVSSAYERITAGTNDITTLVFLFDEIYFFNQIKKDRLTNGVLVREAKEKEGNDNNDKTNARMKHIYQHFVNGTNARAVKSGFVGLLNYDKALRHIESCDVFGDYTDDALLQDKNLMQECLADHAHSVSFYSGIFAAANAYKNGMSIDELKKYLILEPFDSEFVEYKYLNTDGKYDYYVNIDDRIYIAIAKNAWNYKKSYPLGEGMNFYPYWKAKRYITVNKLWPWGEWNGETVEILEIAPVKLKP